MDKVAANSTWPWSIQSAVVNPGNYKHTPGGVYLNKTEYKFAKARVFKVSTKLAKTPVNQLAIPIRDGSYQGEIDRTAAGDKL